MAKEVYTTGEAALLCGISQQSIIRAFDAGRLRGFRIAGGRARRIPAGALRAYMETEGIPTAALDRPVAWVEPDEAARLLNVSRASLDTLVRAGRIATRPRVPVLSDKRNRRRLYALADIERLLEEIEAGVMTRCGI